MTTFFLTDKNGTKHQVNEQQLQALAAKGKIQPTTPLESDTGHQGLAGQIPGLQFSAVAPTPFTQPMQAPPSANVFCTNCGNPVSEHAVACMSCGAKPVGHQKFCRHCGVALNSEQVVCLKCGNAVQKIGRGGNAGGASYVGNSGQQRSRSIFVLFALLFGGLGVHNFYAGRKLRGFPLGVLNILLSIAMFICLCIGIEQSDKAATFERYYYNALNAGREDALLHENSRMASFHETCAATFYFLVFVLATGHFIWIIRDVACCTTDGDGVPMT